MPKGLRGCDILSGSGRFCRLCFFILFLLILFHLINIDVNPGLVAKQSFFLHSNTGKSLRAIAFDL